MSVRNETLSPAEQDAYYQQIARKNRTMALVLGLVIAALLFIAYLFRFSMWHVFFKA